MKVTEHTIKEVLNDEFQQCMRSWNHLESLTKYDRLERIVVPALNQAVAALQKTKLHVTSITEDYYAKQNIVKSRHLDSVLNDIDTCITKIKSEQAYVLQEVHDISNTLENIKSAKSIAITLKKRSNKGKKRSGHTNWLLWRLHFVVFEYLHCSKIKKTALQFLAEFLVELRIKNKVEFEKLDLNNIKPEHLRSRIYRYRNERKKFRKEE